MASSTENSITIKNMVCPRCIQSVEQIIHALGLHPLQVKLGKVTLKDPIPENLKVELSKKLAEAGFEIVEDYKTRKINQIKTLIIERVHYSGDPPDQNLSDYLSSKLNYDYSRISKLFSSIEGITIERYATLQRIERAKELLVYDQHSITEIAEELGYSSPAHFSNRFKSETGMTPKQFKGLLDPPRSGIDSI